jgi:hypothetical protein
MARVREEKGQGVKKHKQRVLEELEHSEMHIMSDMGEVMVCLVMTRTSRNTTDVSRLPALSVERGVVSRGPETSIPE